MARHGSTLFPSNENLQKTKTHIDIFIYPYIHTLKSNIFSATFPEVQKKQQRSTEWGEMWRGGNKKEASLTLALAQTNREVGTFLFLLSFFLFRFLFSFSSFFCLFCFFCNFFGYANNANFETFVNWVSGCYTQQRQRRERGERRWMVLRRFRFECQ